jgi:hypothetical protein
MSRMHSHSATTDIHFELNDYAMHIAYVRDA